MENEYEFVNYVNHKDDYEIKKKPYNQLNIIKLQCLKILIQNIE